MAHQYNAERQRTAQHLMPASSAPPSYDSTFVHCAPPPSYEQSLQKNYQAPQGAYGYTNPYQAHMQQQQIYYHQQPTTKVVMSKNTNTQTATPQVLTFTKGAVIRRAANGAVTVPPPPPGYAATPAQLAAMQGQNVMVKEQKITFF